MTTGDTKRISSLDIFQNVWRSFIILGIRMPTNYLNKPKLRCYRFLYRMWSIVPNVLATCSLPFHFTLGILLSESRAELFDGVTITITSIGASMKILCFAINMQKIYKIESIIRKLDARVTHEADVKYYHEQVQIKKNFLRKMYPRMYIGVCVVAVVATVLSSQRRLFYPGWVPFDWRISNINYAAAIFYQFAALFFQVQQCFVCDSYPPSILCLLSNHIDLLCRRVQRIGQVDNKYGNTVLNEESQKQQERELDMCVEDQVILYELYHIIQDVISWPIFIQIFLSVTNNCVGMVALLFFVNSTFDQAYYTIYLLALTLQLFPACYYGSDFSLRFDKLPMAAYSCNWTEQTKNFKRHLMLFTERSLRSTIALAGGMFPINVATFFATLKGTYSLFAVIISMK